MFTALVTTMDKYASDTVLKGGIVDTTKMAGSIKEYQKVIAIGSSVRDIKVGDLVCINPTRFAVKKHQAGSLKDGVVTDNPIIGYNFETVNIDGKDYLMLQDRDISFVVENWEEQKEAPAIVQPDKSLIV